MEEATKWDAVCAGSRCHLLEGSALSSTTTMALLESELDRARARIVELEEEKRATRKRLERFLRKLEQEKQRLEQERKDELRLERRHRRELEAANGRLLREVSAARLAAKQQSNSYEMERKARVLMEEACSEVTREVEEDQTEVELLRGECLRMREEMEEERRMLQMAEVWREERVQMKLSDAKLALEHKYSQLNRLQAEMEAFLSHRPRHTPAADAAMSLPPPPPPHHHHNLVDEDEDDDDDNNKVDVDSVFEHFRRKEKEKMQQDQESSSSRSNSNGNSNLDECESPATDLFLAKADDQDQVSEEDSGSCDPSVPVSSFFFSHADGASRRSGTSKNTALIRRLWRSAITESRSKAGAEQCTTSASGSAANQHHSYNNNRKQKQSLMEKLMQARMDDLKEKPPPPFPSPPRNQNQNQKQCRDREK